MAPLIYWCNCHAESVADTQTGLEHQRRQADRGVAYQVGGKDPCRQRQLGVVHQTGRGQRGLESATVGLKLPAGSLA